MDSSPDTDVCVESSRSGNGLLSSSLSGDKGAKKELLARVGVDFGCTGTANGLNGSLLSTGGRSAVIDVFEVWD